MRAPFTQTAMIDYVATRFRQDADRRARARLARHLSRLPAYVAADCGVTWVGDRYINMSDG